MDALGRVACVNMEDDVTFEPLEQEVIVVMLRDDIGQLLTELGKSQIEFKNIYYFFQALNQVGVNFPMMAELQQLLDDALKYKNTSCPDRCVKAQSGRITDNIPE